MTIDKFGRSLKSRDGPFKGPKGDGFNLTPDGDYDIQNKRLCNLKRPSSDHDAVTKQFIVDSTIILNENKEYFDANKCFIRHVKSPLNSDDAATKDYVDHKSIPSTSEHYLIGNKILREVRDSEIESDAVNLKMLKAETKSALKLVDDTFYDCQSKQLKNCSDPTDFQDVLNLNYIVRLLSKILFDIYNTLEAPIQTNKDEWIKTHVINKYFLDENARQFRNKDDEEIIEDTDPFPNFLRTGSGLKTH